MRFDISRDFMDGILLQHPAQPGPKAEIKANVGLNFLPSSPDGTMHTAIVAFALQLDGSDKVFARGDWRFLFTTDEAFDPKTDHAHPFARGLLVQGSFKIMTVLNSLCIHANMPLIPFEPQRLANAPVETQPATGQKPDAKPG